MGPCAVRHWHDVARACADDYPVSVALGELLDASCSICSSDFDGITFAKLGLARCGTVEDWHAQWQRRLSQLPRSLQQVAVCYADEATAAAPRMETILDAGIELGCGALLVDTYRKDGGDVFAACSYHRLESLFDRARRWNVLVALAGSLTLATLDRALALAPDIIAVRGAACRGNRTDAIDEACVRRLAHACRTARDSSPSPQ
jgi:hypothetical protein